MDTRRSRCFRTRTITSTPAPELTSARSRFVSGSRIVSGDSSVALLIVAAAHLHLVWRRLLAYLRYFQQEGYDALRFGRWVHVRSLTDPALWLSVVCVLLMGRYPHA